MTGLRFILCALLAMAPFVVPALSHAAPPLEVYGRLPETEMVAMSPSGKRLALVATVKEQRRLIVLEDGKVIISQPVGEQKARNVSWAGEDRVMLQVSRAASIGIDFTTNMAEITSMIVIPIGKDPIWAIFERDKSIYAGVSGFYGVFGENGRYGYFGGIKAQPGLVAVHVSAEGPALYRVDLETKTKELVARQPIYASRKWLLGADGQIVATLDYKTADGDWVIKNADNKTLASGRSPAGSVRLISLGRTAGTVLYRKRKDDIGDGYVIELPLDGSPETELLNEELLSRYLYDGPTRQLIGYVSSEDRKVHFFDPQRDKIVTATRKAFPGLAVDIVDWNDAFDRLLVRTSGNGDAGTWWLVDRKARSASAVAVAYPIEPQDVGPISTFAYTAADGLKMSGILTLPPGRPARNLPVVLLPHGGPRDQDDPIFNWWPQALASRGYAVFQPNFRGSTGFGRDFERAGWGEWGRKMQTDISNGLNALAGEGIVDAKRACIMGASYGGYAALAGVTLQKGIYRCAVSVAGISDVGKMVSNDLSERNNNSFLMRSLKAEIGSGRDLAKVSPIRFAERSDAPVLLIHGADDIVVPYSQSSEMATALSRAGKPVEILKLSGEDHWLSRGETRLTMLKAAVAFVEKHNPPDPTPGK